MVKKEATEVLEKYFNKRKNNVVNLNNILVKTKLRIFMIEFFVMVNMVGVTLNQVHQFIMRKVMGLIIMKMIKQKLKSKEKRKLEKIKIK